MVATIGIIHRHNLSTGCTHEKREMRNEKNYYQHVPSLLQTILRLYHFFISPF